MLDLSSELAARLLAGEPVFRHEITEALGMVPGATGVRQMVERFAVSNGVVIEKRGTGEHHNVEYRRRPAEPEVGRVVDIS